MAEVKARAEARPRALAAHKKNTANSLRDPGLRDPGLRDPSRAMKGTVVSIGKALKAHELDASEAQRLGRGAHAAPVPMGGYDLQRPGSGLGRAIPAWTRRNG